uniref:Uncharacterized protein n=1 Tax=Utricularia reniformis TaxID=192314 RepID=A0A1Y0B209_9LAMI|nr:hypothetical protein AEK19_MT1210 [Utricularia reniformis]ART31424.1 hypothetical protein AEK19_MT1210 [Utricularia reniformis]
MTKALMEMLLMAIISCAVSTKSTTYLYFYCPYV